MNIRATNITNTSFVVQWDEVDDADQYTVNWRSDGNAKEAFTTRTSCTVRELTPNTTYYVTVTARNSCGHGASNNFLNVKTSGLNTLVTPLLSSMASSTSSTNVYNPSTITTPTGTYVRMC